MGSSRLGGEELQVLSTHDQWIMTGWNSNEEGGTFLRCHAAYLGVVAPGDAKVSRLVLEHAFLIAGERQDVSPSNTDGKGRARTRLYRRTEVNPRLALQRRLRALLYRLDFLSRLNI